MRAVLILSIVFFGGLLQGTVSAETNQKTAKSEVPSETDGSKLSSIVITTGGFLSSLTDDVYVSNKEKKIVKDIKGNFAKSFGTLAHVPLITSSEWNKGRFGIAASAGFGLNGSDIVENLQFVVGGSILFNTENALIALTYGRMVGPVQRLRTNYAEGKDFPDGNAGITKSVYKPSHFWALTLSGSLEKLSRYFNIDDTFKRETTTTDEKKEVGK